MMRGSVFSSFIEKLRKNRKLELLVYTVLIAVAAVIFLLSCGISCGGSADGVKTQSEAKQDITREEQIERKLEAILSRIDGAGEVKVMLTLASGASSGESRGTALSDELFRLSSDEDIKQSLGSSDEYAEIIGVIVVASGARDIMVKTRLESAVVTVLGTEPSRVSIFPMGGL